MSLSKTGRPISLNTLMAGGPVMSLARTRSTWDTSKSPSSTKGRLRGGPESFASLSFPLLSTLLLYRCGKRKTPRLRLQTGAKIRGTTLVSHFITHCLTRCHGVRYSVPGHGSRSRWSAARRSSHRPLRLFAGGRKTNSRSSPLCTFGLWLSKGFKLLLHYRKHPVQSQ